MTAEEYENFADLDGEVVSESTEFYQVTEYDDGEVEITPVSEGQALRGALNDHGPVMQAAQTATNSWMSLTLTSSKVSNGNILLKNSFKWLKSPIVGLTDVLAITHSASAVKVPNTDSFTYKYTDGVGTHAKGATATVQSTVGTAKKFDLKVIGSNAAPTNQHGYMSFQVRKGNQYDIRANAFGHYTHVTIGFTGTITLKPGSITVGGNLQKSEANVPMIMFNY